MRLDTVSIQGYKRFVAKSVLYTRGKITCLVGPNEAGKTSLLEALDGLWDDGWPGTWVFSGRVKPADDTVILEARYSIEEADLELAEELLADGPLATPVRELSMAITVTKNARGESQALLHGAPLRDLTERHRLAAALSAAPAGEWLQQIMEGDQALFAQFEPVRAQLAEDLASEERDLTDEAKARLVLCVEMLDRAGATTGAEIQEELTALSDEEHRSRPGQVLVGPLIDRCPRFLLFREQLRELPSFQPFKSEPSEGLRSLFVLAGLDFGDMQSAASANDRARLATYQHRGNATLKKALQMWSQAHISVQLNLSVDGVEVHVLERDLDELTRFEERSLGLRTYVALLAFVSSQGQPDQAPILLVDDLRCTCTTTLRPT